MVVIPECPVCKHYLGRNENGNYYCKAFPYGIPDDVFWGKKSHIEHIDGDNGFVFEMIEE